MDHLGRQKSLSSLERILEYRYLARLLISSRNVLSRTIGCREIIFFGRLPFSELLVSQAKKSGRDEHAIRSADAVDDINDQAVLFACIW